MKCPCCGGELGVLEEARLPSALRLTPTESLIVAKLSGGLWVRMDDLCNGTSTSIESIRVMLVKLRRKLNAVGYAIETKTYFRRLVKITEK